jgi:hypothetical protein
MTGSGLIRHLGGVTADDAIANPPYGPTAFFAITSR